MALKPSTKNVATRGSLLDRLIDDEETPRAHALRLGDLRAAIRRDLEMLLNTRYRCVGWPADLKELENSVFNYGLPDLLAMDMAAEEDRLAFVKTVEEVIRRSDTRFREVTIHLLENSDELDRTLRFRIEAIVQVDPAAEQIVFDTTVDPATKSITIKSR
ncbi:type VI secretion system baseplate subunit TssE [Fodinicurvata sp. EGI_FJ10296]|uniref:type VI secretion system baseplate subunit TssE n=1 Tax=Fodinicurvata sp. EGI_FJ10296 TaxID=3231908 RepID=UPI0034515C41